MSEFCLNYLAEDWEKDTLCELLSMTQGTSSFGDYTIAIQFKNSILWCTVLHLPNDMMCHQLSTGIEIRLLKKVSLEKVNKVLDFYKWLNDVLYMEREEYEWMMRDNRETSCCMNFLNKPSTSSSAMNSAPHKLCLKLLDSKQKLLNKKDVCLKCRKFVVNHCAVNCPNDFPNPVTYRSITQADIDHFKCIWTQGFVAIAPIQYPSDMLDTVSESIIHPVAAMLGVAHNPVAYVIPNRAVWVWLYYDFCDNIL